MSGSPRPSTPPELSVIVVVRDDRERVVDCLRSITSQWPGAPAVEIVVIDDGSTDGTPDVVRRRFPDVRLVCKEHEGADLSRNRGIEESTGRLIAFIDSDCVAGAAWIESMVGLLEAEPSTVVGGRVAHHGPFVRRLIGIADFGEYQGHERRKVRCLPTCNLGLARSTLGETRFDPRVAAAGGDTVFTETLRRGGAALFYDPRLEVEHRPSASWAGFMDRAKRYGASFVRARLLDPELGHANLVRAGVPGIIVATAARIWLDWLRLIKHRRRAGFAIWELPAAAAALAVRRVVSFPAAIRALRTETR